MPIARCNDIEICYETSGDPGGRPLVLIMGMGNQMVRWPPGFCDRLVARGHYVVRFDNRDVGHSTRLDAVGIPDIGGILRAIGAGEVPSAPYTLSDMAADTVGLMDALGLERAHLFGISLGGMIAQTVAIEHPERTLTLTSLMSTTGRLDLPAVSAEATQLLSRRAPGDREAYVEHVVTIDRFLTGPHMRFDEEASRRYAEQAFDRGPSPQAVARQVAAVLASGSRHEALPALRLPALILHGDADPLVPVECGRDTAACMPGARYVEIPGLAHSLPAQVWDLIVDEVSKLTS